MREEISTSIKVFSCYKRTEPEAERKDVINFTNEGVHKPFYVDSL